MNGHGRAPGVTVRGAKARVVPATGTALSVFRRLEPRERRRHAFLSASRRRGGRRCQLRVARGYRANGTSLDFQQNAIPCHERHVVRHTRGSNEHVSRVALDVQTGAQQGNLPREGPHVDPRERPDDVGVVQVDDDPAQLGELRNLPKHDGRDTPAMAREDICLARLQGARQRVQQDVGVKVQHANRPRSTGGHP